jgi:N-acetylneuraminate synthase
MDTMAVAFGLPVGYSDHTAGIDVAIAAVARGARIIEKHFTDDVKRVGPDHAFSMDPVAWKEMVDRTRELEASLGGEVKKIEDNEKQTSVLQRRSIRLARDVAAGEVLARDALTMLRPCPEDALPPYEVGRVVGRRAKRVLKAGEIIRWTEIE